MSNELTQPAQPAPSNDEAELLARKQAFVLEYGELVKKHRMDFAQYPMWVPDPSVAGAFKTIIQTTPVPMGEKDQKPFVTQ